jgi:putative ABC transport system permease protein
MRQRALGTWLTLLSVLLGVALAIAILLLRDAGQALFGQTEYGYDVIVGIGKGSPLQLVMNTVYHIDKSPGNVPYWVYEQLNTQTREAPGSRQFDFHRHVRLAVPIAVGDTYAGRPIVGTPPKMFVSLDPLRQQLTAILETQNEILKSTRDPNHEAPVAQQEALIARVAPAKQQVIKTGQEIVPLLDVRMPEGAQSKWKYGDPVSPKCDAAAREMRAAVDAMRADHRPEAAAYQDTAYRLIADVLASVNANSGPLEYQPEKTYQLGQGRFFHAWKFEAVIGSEVAEKTDLRLGSQFHATHGTPQKGETPDVHPELWQVVGVLKPTHTSADRCVFIPLISFYSIAEHEKGLEAHDKTRQGQAAPADDDDKPKFDFVYGDQLCPDLPHTKDFLSLYEPSSKWEVSAILIESRGGVTGQRLIYFISNGGIPDVQAVNPAQVMQQFFQIFLAPSAQLLLLISLLVSIVAGVGILVSIYNSVAARTREIAILRALGATRGKVLTLICTEAVLIGLVGSILGVLVGHGIGAIASARMEQDIGQGFNWFTPRPDEWVYCAVVVGIALVAGLVPALKAYRTPVATNLVAA